MGAKNQPGAVVKLLQPLADAGISMSKLESRPARSGNWEYLFFVVCEGHRQDAQLAAALAEIESRAAFSKFSVLIPLHRDVTLLRPGAAACARHCPLSTRQADLGAGARTRPGRSRYRQAGVERKPARPQPAWRWQPHRMRCTTWPCIPTAPVMR
jgi:hypothetical protein